MGVGMLWFDNDPKVELGKKIERAASYYREKYGKTPTLCYVHPSMLANGRGLAKNAPAAAEHSHSKEHRESPSHFLAGIEIRPNRSVLPNHFWIGLNGSAEHEKASS